MGEIGHQLRRGDQQFAFAATGAQSRIDRKHHAVAGVGGQRLHDLLGGSGERLAILVLSTDEQDVRVRQDIEFGAAQTSYGHHGQALRCARNVESGGDCVFRGGRGRSQRGVDLPQFGDVTSAGREHAMAIVLA